MPLKDRDRDRPRRLARLGIIRLGHKEKRTKHRSDGSAYEVEYPVQDDHFVLTDAPEIAEVYGDRPRELDVILPFPDVMRNFDADYTVWAGGVLVCKGDGDYVEQAAPLKVVKAKTGKLSVRNAAGDTLVYSGVAQVAFSWNGEAFEPGDHVPCPGARADLYPHCAACRVSAVLKVMMARPDLFRLGYYQISTGSGRNYDTILGTLELIHAQTGRVNGIPFKLRLVKEPTMYIEKGKRHKTEKWFLQIEPDPDFTRRLYSQQAARILDAGEPEVQAPALGAGEFDEAEPEAPPPFAEAGDGVTVDVETGEIIEAEPHVEAADVMVENKDGKDVRLSDLGPTEWRYIVGNPKKYDAEARAAAHILLEAAQ
jgi:hypothetical protein